MTVSGGGEYDLVGLGVLSCDGVDYYELWFEDGSKSNDLIEIHDGTANPWIEVTAGAAGPESSDADYNVLVTAYLSDGTTAEGSFTIHYVPE